MIQLTKIAKGIGTFLFLFNLFDAEERFYKYEDKFNVNLNTRAKRNNSEDFLYM